MPRKRTPSSLQVIGGAILFLVALIRMVPVGVWIALGLAGLAWYFFLRPKRPDALAPKRGGQASPSSQTYLPSSPAPSISQVPAGRRDRSRAAVSGVRPPAEPGFHEQRDVPVSVLGAAPGSVRPFRVPAAPAGYGQAKWLHPGETANVSGVTIPGGMIYVGTTLTAPSGASDPCLIDPSLPVAVYGNYAVRDMGYWPSYSSASLVARRAYLAWLASGRQDPTADIGYVFLFLYGLERRALVDAESDPAARADWPHIAEELRRLLAIYGEKSGSFRTYAGSLLDWVSLADHPEKAYLRPVPSFPRTFELPLYLRVALGQAAVDGAPVPPRLALAWARHDPTINLRTPARRCVQEFDELFILRYKQEFGEGMVLPKNRTKLKVVHRPASAAFFGQREFSFAFGDTPDITAVTGPVRNLQSVVDSVTERLERFSRSCANNPDAKRTLDGLVFLPVAVWPETAKEAVRSLKQRADAGPAPMLFSDLLSTFGGVAVINKARLSALVGALESQGVAFEPDVLGGARAPKPDESVVLFSVDSGGSAAPPTPSYQAAVLTVQLATAVATADDGIGDEEVAHIRQQVSSWSHLTADHIRRLTAHIELLRTQPVTLASLKKKLQPLSVAARESIAQFMATVAQSDGTVSPSEVKMLQRVYQALGVDASRVFTDLHAAGSGSQPGLVSNSSRGAPFRLDADRIAALQRDTEAVSVLLADIFTDEEPPQPAPVVSDDEPEESDSAPDSAGLMGLDEAHSAFARLLLSRAEWAEEELEDAAADLDLMLAGAIELLNEAALDTHDVPFFEGEAPVTVNPEILEKLAA
ncbi:MAG: TerB N-terminal domain-containing protein [Gemmatimonadales bacterium]